MLAAISKEERIFEVYEILKRKMRKLGRDLSLSQNTDPKKTYSWRYLSNFVDKLDELNIEIEYAPVVIDALILHATRKKLLGRGFAILNKIDIIELVVKSLERHSQVESNRYQIIKKSHEFLLKQQQITNRPMAEVLAAKRRIDSYTNMTCWLEQGQLSLEYIAVSKTCRRVLNIIKSNEKVLYQDTMALMRMRMLLLSNHETRDHLRHLLGTDLFES